MKTTYEVIDDFLPSDVFNKLQNLLLPVNISKDNKRIKYRDSDVEELPSYYIPAGNVIKEGKFVTYDLKERR